MRAYSVKEIEFLRRRCKKIARKKKKRTYRKKYKVQESSPITAPVKSLTSFLNHQPSRNVNRKARVKPNHAKTKSRFSLRPRPVKEELLKFPKTFSLLNNTEGTLRFISSVTQNGGKAYIEGLNFDQTDCVEIGFGAASILNIIASDLSQNHKLRLTGKLPDDNRLARLVWATGLPKTLGLSRKDALSRDFPEFTIFETRRHLPLTAQIKSDRASEVELAITDLADYFQDCYRRSGIELPLRIVANIEALVGEAIDNCVEHGSPLFGWWLSGYQEILSETQSEIRFSIINLGESIPSTLKKIQTDGGRTLINVQNFLSAQKENAPRRYEEDCSWAILALQPGYSQHGEAEAGKRRGVGMMNLLREFSHIGQLSSDPSSPRLTIITGNVGVFLNRNHVIKDDQSVIALNAENSLEWPPDRKVVRKLRNTFKGTIISAVFHIDKNILSAKYSDEEGQGNDKPSNH